jgi:hypothetical protein
MTSSSRHVSYAPVPCQISRPVANQSSPFTSLRQLSSLECRPAGATTVHPVAITPPLARSCLRHLVDTSQQADHDRAGSTGTKPSPNASWTDWDARRHLDHLPLNRARPGQGPASAAAAPPHVAIAGADGVRCIEASRQA